MKNKNTLLWLLLCVPIPGAAGAALRYWLFATGIDEKGLIIADHPAQLLIWVLTLVVAIALVIATWNLKGTADYRSNFPRSILGAAGFLLAAAAAAVTLMPRLQSAMEPLNIAGLALGGASVLSLLVLAVFRYLGKRPNPIFLMITCAWLMVDLVLMYRQWSATPQVQNYCFSLLANVCVMLSVYYSATFAADMGNRQMHSLFHLLAVFFCIVSLPQCESPLYFALMCAFMMLDICALNPKPKEV